MQTSSPIRRNQICPCGSGLRFKHCHGKYPLPDRSICSTVCLRYRPASRSTVLRTLQK
ncbi:SEC-C metal-binding domain-containing protein [Bradyrhizobium sp. USDA 4452]